MSQNTEGNESTPKEERQIDLMELWDRVWRKKRQLLFWCIVGALLGIVIAFSIPTEYSASVKLAPEVKNGRVGMNGNLGALASMAGLSNNNPTSADAVYPQLYPDIVGSIPFATSLFEVPVQDKAGNIYTVREYVVEKIRKPWWSAVIALPGKLFSNGGKDEEAADSLHTLNNFQLTPSENYVAMILRERIKAEVDQKTNVITIDVSMQDPMVAAILVDTVVARLREYVTEYRTNKAKEDLKYAQKLNEEAQQQYYDAQQRLADYIDRNQNLATRSAQINQERLQNEASLAFNLYNETSLQVQNAKSKVQETTPVYTEIIPVTVPMRPSSPRKGLIIGGWIFFAFIICIVWILVGSPILNEYKTRKLNSPTKDEE